jgi:hypothetical protein
MATTTISQKNKIIGCHIIYLSHVCKLEGNWDRRGDYKVAKEKIYDQNFSNKSGELNYLNFEESYKVQLNQKSNT